MNETATCEHLWWITITSRVILGRSDETPRSVAKLEVCS
jgi:hypothetical protein